MLTEVLSFQCDYNFYFPFLTVSMKLIGDKRRNLGITLSYPNVLGDDSYTMLSYGDFFILYSCDDYGYFGSLLSRSMFGSCSDSRRMLKKRLMKIFCLCEPIARCLVIGIFRLTGLNSATFRERGNEDDRVSESRNHHVVVRE